MKRLPATEDNFRPYFSAPTRFPLASHSLPTRFARMASLVPVREFAKLSVSTPTPEVPTSEVSVPEVLVPREIQGCLLSCDLDGMFLWRDNKTPQAEGQYVAKIPRYYPGYSSFGAWCLKNFKVGVWSSATWKNVSEITTNIFGVDALGGRGVQSKLAFVRHREHCLAIDPLKKETLKPLKLVFNNPTYLCFDRSSPNYLKPLYLPSRTLAIDDSPEKMICNPKESWLLPPMTTLEDGTEVVDFYLLRHQIIEKLLALPQGPIFTEPNSLSFSWVVVENQEQKIKVLKEKLAKSEARNTSLTERNMALNKFASFTLSPAERRSEIQNIFQEAIEVLAGTEEKSPGSDVAFRCKEHTETFCECFDA